MRIDHQHKISFPNGMVIGKWFAVWQAQHQPHRSNYKYEWQPTKLDIAMINRIRANALTSFFFGFS